MKVYYSLDGVRHRGPRVPTQGNDHMQEHLQVFYNVVGAGYQWGERNVPGDGLENLPLNNMRGYFWFFCTGGEAVEDRSCTIVLFKQLLTLY